MTPIDADPSLAAPRTAAIDEEAFDSYVSRRGVFGWVSRAGIAVVAATAGMLARTQPASAHTCPGGLYHCGTCCCLAKPNTYPMGPCGAGYTYRSWGCCAGGFFNICAECAAGYDCFTGPWQKSMCWQPGGC